MAFRSWGLTVRIEYHDRDRASRCDIARVARVWLRHPEERLVLAVREPHRRRPGCAIGIRRREGHVRVGVYDGTRGFRIHLDLLPEPRYDCRVSIELDHTLARATDAVR